MATSRPVAYSARGSPPTRVSACQDVAKDDNSWRDKGCTLLASASNAPCFVSVSSWRSVRHAGTGSQRHHNADIRPHGLTSLHIHHPHCSSFSSRLLKVVSVPSVVASHPNTIHYTRGSSSLPILLEFPDLQTDLTFLSTLLLDRNVFAY